MDKCNREEIKKYFSLFFIGFLLGLLMMNKFNNSNLWDIVLGLFGILALLLINIPVWANQNVYIKVASFSLGSLFSLFVHPIESFLHTYSTEDRICMEICIGLVLIVILLMYVLMQRLVYFILSDSTDNFSWKNQNIFPEREADLNRIKKILGERGTQSIGLEAEWGKGKTFLLRGLQESISNEYIFINIDVLAFHMDDYLQYLVNELDTVLRHHGIYSQNSRKLKKILKSTKIDYLSLLWSEEHKLYVDTFSAFKNELLKLNKIIVIVFEDIDRIDDVRYIKTIFYLSEKMTTLDDNQMKGSIKTIYQYCAVNMVKLGFNATFLDKYIDCRVMLSPIGLRDMILAMQEKFISNQNHRLTEAEINQLPPYLYLRRQGIVSPSLEQSLAEKFFVPYITPRRVRNFLKDINVRMQYFSDELLPEDRYIIQAFSFIEHFLPDVFARLKNDSLEEALFFKNPPSINQKWYYCRISRNDWAIFDWERILNPELYLDNFQNYITWRILGLDVIAAHRFNDSSSQPMNFFACTADDIAQQNNLNYVNIERMIKYLLTANQSFYNDYIYWANDLVKAVLNREDPVASFREWVQRMRQSNGSHGIETIQGMGTDIWPAIFQSFQLAAVRWNRQVCRTNYHNLIQLFQQAWQSESENNSDIFTYYTINRLLSLWEGLVDKENYQAVIHYVINLSINGNFNSYANFELFVQRSIYQAVFLEYIDFDVWLTCKSYLDSHNVEGALNTIQEWLNQLIQSLEEYASADPTVIAQYRMLNNYILYLLDVIHNADDANIQEPIQIEDRLVRNDNGLTQYSSISSEQDFYEAINAAFQNGTLSPLQYMRCIHQWEERYRHNGGR